MSELTVVIPTLIHFDLLRNCLNSLANYAPYDYDIVVANGSVGERNCFKVEQACSDVGAKVVHLGGNRKVMGAFNAVLGLIDTKYIALVHDDASFIPCSEHFWPRLVEIASNESVGMCGPSISNCTGLQHFLRWDLPIRVSIPYLYGACMMFRSDTIRDLGGMTEDISPCDDIELAVRVKKNGYEIIIDRGCFLHHERHMTYKITRPPSGEGDRLEEMFNKIISLHGLRNTVKWLFEIPDWGWITRTEPTFDRMLKRLEFSYQEWECPQPQ